MKSASSFAGQGGLVPGQVTTAMSLHPLDDQKSQACLHGDRSRQRFLLGAHPRVAPTYVRRHHPAQRSQRRAIRVSECYCSGSAGRAGCCSVQEKT